MTPAKLDAEETSAETPPIANRSIACVVRIRHLDDPDDDVEYWRSRPPEERIAALEEIRSQYHRWMGNADQRLQRVFSIVKR